MLFPVVLPILCTVIREHESECDYAPIRCPNSSICSPVLKKVNTLVFTQYSSTCILPVHNRFRQEFVTPSIYPLGRRWTFSTSQVYLCTAMIIISIAALLLSAV